MLKLYLATPRLLSIVEFRMIYSTNAKATTSNPKSPVNCRILYWY